MNTTFNRLLTTTLLSSTMLSPSAMALNIVLTNDDSWSTQNIQNLKSALEADGHSVVMSAPCGPQSGKGGSMIFMKSVPVDESRRSENMFCVGETDGELALDEYVEGTPAMSVLYGIDQAAQEVWGQEPDLVISGPNEGNNLGYMNNNSGTLGATMIALSRGIPAIAVSADQVTASDDQQSKLVAKTVVDIVDKLVESQPAGQPLLPAYTGLNVNTPKDMDNNLGYKYTDVGWNAGNMEVLFTGDLSENEDLVKYAAQELVDNGTFDNLTLATAAVKKGLGGKQGVSFRPGDAGDSNENSEGVAVQEGYITISTIDGNVQASRAKVELTRQRLVGLE